MSEEKLLTVREVSLILGISERAVLDLAENGTLPAYKIGGVYLRFRKEQIQEYRKRFIIPSDKGRTRIKNYSFGDRVADYLYFNDFYIASAIIVALLLVVIFSGY